MKELLYCYERSYKEEKLLKDFDRNGEIEVYSGAIPRKEAK